MRLLWGEERAKAMPTAWVSFEDEDGANEDHPGHGVQHLGVEFDEARGFGAVELGLAETLAQAGALRRPA